MPLDDAFARFHESLTTAAQNEPLTPAVKSAAIEVFLWDFLESRHREFATTGDRVVQALAGEEALLALLVSQVIAEDVARRFRTLEDPAYELGLRETVKSICDALYTRGSPSNPAG